MNCDPSYVTSMIDELERAGYATRQSDTNDRRIKTFSLAAAGNGALRAARDELLSPPAQLARLSPTEQRSLARLFRRACDS